MMVAASNHIMYCLKVIRDLGIVPCWPKDVSASFHLLDMLCKYLSDFVSSSIGLMFISWHQFLRNILQILA